MLTILFIIAIVALIVADTFANALEQWQERRNSKSDYGNHPSRKI